MELLGLKGLLRLGHTDFILKLAPISLDKNGMNRPRLRCLAAEFLKKGKLYSFCWGAVWV